MVFAPFIFRTEGCPQTKPRVKCSRSGCQYAYKVSFDVMFQAQPQKSMIKKIADSSSNHQSYLCLLSYKLYNLPSLQRMPAARTVAMNEHLFRDKAEANERKDISILQYRTSRDTRWGYRLLLSDKHRLGYCSNSQASCLPILPALRKREEKAYEAVDLRQNPNCLRRTVNQDRTRYT